MFFWKKDKAKKIVEDLKKTKKTINILRTKPIRETHKLLNVIKNSVIQAEEAYANKDMGAIKSHIQHIKQQIEASKDPKRKRFKEIILNKVNKIMSQTFPDPTTETNLKEIKEIVQLGEEELIKKRVNKTIEIIENVDGYIKDAKKNIQERVDEEIARPMIDERFDSEIQKRADDEIRELDTLKENLGEYNKMIQRVTSEEELHDIVDMMQQEVEDIKQRETEHDKAIKEIQRQTIAGRLAVPGPNIPPNQTNDRVSWSKICKVCRQLGATIIKRSEHQIHITFPGGRRNIPLSGDVSSTVIVGQVIEQLKISGFPAHKVPSRRSLEAAFKKGSLVP